MEAETLQEGERKPDSGSMDRNQGSHGWRRGPFYNRIFVFSFFPGCPQEHCHKAAINCPTGHVPSKYQKAYLPSQEEVKK